MSQVQLPEQITSDSIKNYKQNVNYLPADMKKTRGALQFSW